MKRPAHLSLPLCLAALAACASEPKSHHLIGDWVIEQPTVPRAHGNLVRFREGCVIVSGNRLDIRIAKPARYQDGNDGTLVWYGPAAEAEPGITANAARVTFLAQDRILVVWPQGGESRYLRAVGQAEDLVGPGDCEYAKS
ncbi:MAG: hypothetical protein CL566_03620 [Alphaproteobacteria bacterium]|nr:hypothetical protein [Alphaproteobacteria bacterium]